MAKDEYEKVRIPNFFLWNLRHFYFITIENNIMQNS
jgi:hypothetical protein